MELRYVNHHLRSCKFKYEDIRTAAELDLFSKGDWFFKFDYKSGYHHTEIFCGLSVPGILFLLRRSP